MSEHKTLIEAFVAAYAAMDDPAKNADNGAFKKDGKPIKYVDVGAMLDAVRPILTAHGIAVVQPPVSSENGVGVRTLLIGYGEKMDLGEFFLPLEASTAHKAGGAITYARRYALGSIFGLAAEDDDGNSASGVKTPTDIPSEGQITAVWGKAKALGMSKVGDVAAKIGAVLGTDATHPDNLTGTQVRKVLDALEREINASS